MKQSDLQQSEWLHHRPAALGAPPPSQITKYEESGDCAAKLPRKLFAGSPGGPPRGLIAPLAALFWHTQ